jgi:hypothetical protein
MLGHFASEQELFISKGLKSIGEDLIMHCPCDKRADELPSPRLGWKLSPQLVFRTIVHGSAQLGQSD